MSKFRILVTGSREWGEFDIIERELTDYYNLYKGEIIIIHGECPTGADKAASMVSEKLKCPEIKFRANWKKCGRTAGPIRNKEMLDETKPDMILAYPLRSSVGTKHMIRVARDMHIPIFVWMKNEYKEF